MEMPDWPSNINHSPECTLASLPTNTDTGRLLTEGMAVQLHLIGLTSDRVVESGAYVETLQDQGMSSDDIIAAKGCAARIVADLCPLYRYVTNIEGHIGTLVPKTAQPQS